MEESIYKLAGLRNSRGGSGGIFGTLLLSRSIGSIVAKALRGECESQDIVSALRKVVILILLIIILPWSIIYATVGSMGDQYFRNIVNQLMGGPDLFRHLARISHQVACCYRIHFTINELW